MNLKSKLYPIYNMDAAQIIYDLIFESPPGNRQITINGNKGFSYYELICKISQAINKKIVIIPVPKFLMLTIRWFIEAFRIKAGFVPDQISRLYSFKDTGLALKNMRSPRRIFVYE